ncbi:hypothetical protein [Acinetobacter courvalinii]|uniref:hypothetical protein n=1 Tax=Acinetobacter courvalinii TaxID=280147 RepID=UPI001901C1F5|nr:hypothetical protein [Acinetobacter courvalinii]MBJ8416901.1 hypothetical protein [Acinetobacter courvalinii]
MLKIKSGITILTTAIIISACGGGNDSKTLQDHTTQPITFTTEFQSTLSLQKDAEPAMQVSSSKSNQNDDVDAYSVTHHFDSGSSSIIFSYNLDKNDTNKTLHVNYDPILKEILAVSIGSKRIEIGQLEIGSMQYGCSSSFYDVCKNIKINFDDKTGHSEIIFNNTKLSTPHLTLAESTNTTKSVMTLNGKLTGKLSIPPQSFESIRKTSKVDLSINSQPISPIGIIYEPESKNVTFNTYTDNGVNQGIKSDLFTTLTSYNGGSNSSVYTKSYQASPITGCLGLIDTNIPVQNPLSIQVQETTDKINLTFNQTKYQQTYSPPSDCSTTNLKLDGSITVNKPLTHLTIISDDKNTLIPPLNRPALYFDVVNNNQQEFGNEIIQVTLQNNSIIKINFKEVKLGVDPSTGLLKRFENNFSCNTTQPCQGISYDAVNTKVTFKNTPLYYKDEKNPTLIRVFHINGIFDFAGR